MCVEQKEILGIIAYENYPSFGPFHSNELFFILHKSFIHKEE